MADKFSASTSEQSFALSTLRSIMRDAGASSLYCKRLAENDNSKNQVYLGPDLSALNVLPVKTINPDPENPDRLKAPLNFSWLDGCGAAKPAPGAQLILYPQYPEVRFSGFLRGCVDGPNKLMTTRQPGRVLFVGVCLDGRIFGYVGAHNSRIASELEALNLAPTDGVFIRISLDVVLDDRVVLIEALAQVAASGWISSSRLDRDGGLISCKAPNCGGYTLEAKLGIRPNGFSEPDFHGWEIKQYAVKDLDLLSSGGAITLMTPEPTGGVYAKDGVSTFIRRFGYKDRDVVDRLNFGGIHNALRKCVSTGLSLVLTGYDKSKKKITDPSGGLSLVSPYGEIAAAWPYVALMKHWNRKHARAAYIPSIVRNIPERQYQFGRRVRLVVGTDFLLFLDAVSSGAVYYDPGIKMEDSSTRRPLIKRRSQFRIKSAQIPMLYRAVEEVTVL
jgi:hypothetical protein